MRTVDAVTFHPLVPPEWTSWLMLSCTGDNAPVPIAENTGAVFQAQEVLS